MWEVSTRLSSSGARVRGLKSSLIQLKKKAKMTPIEVTKARMTDVRRLTTRLAGCNRRLDA